MLQAQVIAAYEGLLEQARRMLACAENADWDGIFALKSQGLIDAASLQRAESQAELDEAGQLRKLELISEIVALDTQVSRHLHARQSYLGKLMQVGRQKCELDNTYRGKGEVISLGHRLYQ
ncbi:flagellar protein FliT [Pseudomonas sp. PSKL.D1]|uniref:flagellar protein FliT n=1 Tax=Pseudomonas sp. PSKL.D1 TaxID=3029060 RepID=UPI0023810BE6|nr:flagellar protein FliT [Pseudomonas sp. PSKL.D1]WDY57907.1 flagellar protein FliT [Pseudomonas sp. PSKL.D1]